VLNRVKSLEVVAQTHCLPFAEPVLSRYSSFENLRTNGGQSSSAEMISSQLPSPPPIFHSLLARELLVVHSGRRRPPDTNPSLGREMSPHRGG
jgi:hypothetical protein